MVSLQVIARISFDRSLADDFSELLRADFLILDLLIPGFLSPPPNPITIQLFQCIYHSLADFCRNV